MITSFSASILLHVMGVEQNNILLENSVNTNVSAVWDV